MISKEYTRAISALILAAIAILWVFINSGHYIIEGLVYVVMIVFCIFLYTKWGYVGTLFGKSVNGKGGENRLVGISGDYKKGIIVGVLAFVGFLLLNTFGVIGAIGIPSVQAIKDSLGKALILVIVAPIVEELFFRDFVLDYFDRKLFGNLPFVFAAIFSGAIFSLFHFVAYGESLIAASGSFWTAGIVGFVGSYMRKYTNSNLGNIIFHALINLWVGVLVLSVIVA